jgi:hypothetical protein
MIKQATTVAELQQLVREYGACFRHVSLAAAVNTLGNWQQRGKLSGNLQQQQVQQLLADIEQLPQLQQLLMKCRCRQLSQLVWGLGLLGHTQTGLFAACLDQFMQQQHDIDRAQQSANVLYGAAKAGWQMEGGQVQQLLAALVRLLPDAKPQEIANSLWAAATLGKAPLLQQTQQLLAALVRLLPDAKPQEVANSLWAAAKLEQAPTEQQTQQLLAALLRLLPDAKPQDVANSLWAAAKVGHAPTEQQTQQVQQLLAALMRLLPDATPQAVANSLWAAATLKAAATQQQLQQLLQHLNSRLANAKPQHVANSLWAVAKLAQQLNDQQQQQLQQSQHLQQLLAGLAGKLAAAESQAVSNSLWACAQLRVYPAELFAALDSQQHWDRLLPAMNGQELANTALASAVLDYRDEQWLAGLLQHALQLHTTSSSSCSQLSSQELCNLCWSVAVLDLQQLASIVVQLVQAAGDNQQQWKEFKTEELSQLHQVHLWLLDRQLVGGMGLAGALTQQQLLQCSSAWFNSLQSRSAQAPSAIQQQVFAALQQLTAACQLSWQQPPAMEQLAVPDAACLIDIAGVTADGVRLAIEVDGPTHFLWTDMQLDGSTQHRNRVLAARGYVVVGVPYFEWNKRAGVKRQQQLTAGQVQYLQQLIDTATQQHQGNMHHDGHHHHHWMMIISSSRQCRALAGGVHASAAVSSSSRIAANNSTGSSHLWMLLQGLPPALLLLLLLLPPATPAPVGV